MADMFRAVVCSSTGRLRRWWSTLPLSVGLHGLIFAAAVIVPLAATGALPTPASMLSFSLAPPPPPPEVPVGPRVGHAVAQAPAPVPAEAPAAIVPDPPPETTPSASPVTMTGAIVVGSGSGASWWQEEGNRRPVVLSTPLQAPIRPGDLVRVPVKVVEVAPVYPPLAIRAHVAGVVTIDAVIGVDGRVTEARVLGSVALLDHAALDAVRQWRYTPTLLNGVAVPVILTVRVNFALK
jgi:protein TonB